MSPMPAPTAARRPRRPDPATIHRIADDAQALEVARHLAVDFAREAAARDRERRLPWDELERWSQSGLGGITVPREHGGAGVSHATLAEVTVITCAADPALGQIPQNHYALLAVLRETGSAEQQRRFYAEVLAGLRLGNGGPERKASSGTVLASAPRLAAHADGLRLDGHRYYSTGALFAHRIPTRAIDAEGRPVQAWVPFDAPGLTVIDDWDALGQRTTASGSVVFDGVRVDPADVLPVWQLAQRPGITGPTSQLIQAAIDQGIAQAALDDAMAFVRERSRPWIDAGVERASDDPYVIAGVGRLQIALHAAHEVLLEAAATLDEIGPGPVSAEESARASVAVAHAKVLTTRIALDAAETLFELAGASATRAAHALDRHWRNARTHTLHDPVRWKTHLIGNHVLNAVLPARHAWN